MLIPSLSVGENLLLGRMPHRKRRIDWRAVGRRAAEILEQWDVRVTPKTMAGDLDVEQAQLLEIAKALSHGSDLIVLDEPTARLDSGAASRLFAGVQRLREAGATFLFISHYLHEVFDVCDEVSVLRDGRRIGTHVISEVTPHRLVEEMIGDTPPPATTARAGPAPGQPRLRVTGLTGERFRSVDLSAAPGEIVGIAGLVSSGRSQIGEARPLRRRHRPLGGNGRPMNHRCGAGGCRVYRPRPTMEALRPQRSARTVWSRASSEGSGR